MSALILDAGNTNVTAAVWNGADDAPAPTGAPALDRPASWPTPTDECGDADVAAAVRALAEDRGASDVVLVSVVPRFTAALQAAIPGLKVADHRAGLPFETTVADPAACGADRLCNAAAAVAAGLRSALLVDVGTATTVDVLVEGVHLGGVIAPGPATAASSLATRTSRLFAFPLRPVVLQAATDTLGAMTAGSWHAAVGGVESLITGLTQAHGVAPVVVTGGFADSFAGKGRLVDRDWTLRGAAVLAGLAG